MSWFNTMYGERRSTGCTGQPNLKHDNIDTSPPQAKVTDNDFNSAVSLADFLHSDERPIFVLDLRKEQKTIKPVFCNKALAAAPRLEEFICTGKGPIDPDLFGFSFSNFETWALADAAVTDGYDNSVTFSEIHWIASTHKNRWRVISGSIYGRALATFGDERAIIEAPEALPLESGLAELLEAKAKARTNYLKFFREYDWASTELGPLSTWSEELKIRCKSLLADSRPTAMFWGDDKITLYNAAYSTIAGSKHPQSLGQSFWDVWPEATELFKNVFSRAEALNEGISMDDVLFCLDRNEYLEETYFSWSIVPRRGKDGIYSFYNGVFDTTNYNLAQRRMSTLLRVSQCLATATEVKGFWNLVLQALEPNEFEVPFCLAYSADEDIDGNASQTSDNLSKNWICEGSIAGADDKCAEAACPFKGDVKRCVPNFEICIQKLEPTLLRRSEGTYSTHLVGDTRDRGFKDQCQDYVLIPVRPTTGENVIGFLILGVNPRRPYDNDYEQFIHLLSRQLATAAASALLLEEEVRRSELAAKDRKVLSEQLAIRTYEAVNSTERFRRLSEWAPVGMFNISMPDGLVLYANDSWYDLTQHPRNAMYPMSWYNVIDKGDHQLMDKEWEKLANGIPVSFEIRLTRPWISPEIDIDGKHIIRTTWIIAAAYPERSADGTVTSVYGTLTDISKQKWAEDFQTRTAKEAVEMKTQQEKFIDVTSHEMRNPLSAMIQCADLITSISEFDVGGAAEITISKDLMCNISEAAQTITLCAQHQKRIIDDVLILSRLESDMLQITPVDTQVLSVVTNALKMFDGELQEADMRMDIKIDESYKRLKVDWLRLDPSRLIQILINLATNAIKFTKTEAKREILITISASNEKPQMSNCGIRYLDRVETRKKLSDSEFGNGPDVYLQLTVADTGKGLSEHESQKLFRRFSQANARTHVKYGGSGLGLFISRELTELQGGQIGFSSKAGVGSTFAFYVKAKHSEPSEALTAAKNSDHLKNNLRNGIISNADRHLASKQPQGESSPRLSGVHITGTVGRVVHTPTEASRHVLIVEDNLVNQKVLSKQLLRVGCTVHVANHGVEALVFLKKTRFWTANENGSGQKLSLILMDLEMPIMDGMTCVKEIRKLQKERKVRGHVPIIAVTANVRDEQIRTAKAAGMDSVVTKPFRIPELIPEMERLVEVYQSTNADINAADNKRPSKK